MTIVKREEIHISQKENEAFDLVEKICEGLQKESNDPEILRLTKEILNNLYDFYEYVVD